MKLTTQHLKALIKETLRETLKEGWLDQLKRKQPSAGELWDKWLEDPESGNEDFENMSNKEKQHYKNQRMQQYINWKKSPEGKDYLRNKNR